MISPLSLIPAPYRVIVLAVAAALVLLSCYAVGRSDGAASVHVEWDRDKLVRSDAAREAESGYRKRENELNNKLNEAQNEARKREVLLRAAADAARRSNDGLRDDLAAIRRGLPGDSPEACRLTANAALAVFGECAAALGELAVKADGHASDAETLSDAWPE